MAMAEAICAQYGLKWFAGSAFAVLRIINDRSLWIVSLGGEDKDWIDQETDDIPHRLRIDAETGECLELEVGPRGRTVPLAAMRARNPL
jgi:hypothetical protein